MNRFSISELASYSGIKAPTIRKWEERYNVLSPKRTEGNTRYYSGDELRRIICIASLMGMDYKISALCEMNDKERDRLIQKHVIGGDRINEQLFNLYINQLINTSLQFDEIRFNKLFSRCIFDLGIEKTYANIIYPLLVRLGLMWSAQTLAPSQEHFITNQIKIRFYESIANLQLPINPLDTWLLFLPEDEFHDLGLNYAYYITRKAGRRVIFLGANVPYESLKLTVKDTNPNNLLFFMGKGKRHTEIQAYLNSMNKDFQKQKIYVAGKFDKEIKWPKNINPLTEINDLKAILNR